MEWNLTEATAYIQANTLDNEDFIDADAERQTTLLNVASRTLTRKYSAYTIPNEAVYIFASDLGAAYNDTNKLAQQGVAGFSVKGISFTFKDWAKKGIDAFISEEIIDLIGEANGVVIPTGRSIKWVTL